MCGVAPKTLPEMPLAINAGFGGTTPHFWRNKKNTPQDSMSQFELKSRPLVKERTGRGGYMTVSGGGLWVDWLAGQLGPLVVG
ncbi:hypothetical protein J6590_022445 [Homalodisca vitripennis]|nr:hypothetical protein J6590_022445 [Homalodisca vitripennis]